MAQAQQPPPPQPPRPQARRPKAEVQTPNAVEVAAAVMMGQPKWTAGAALHAAGRCRPCAWFWKPTGCMNAEECSYCHLCPEGELKSRKKSKVTAMRMGALTPVRSLAQAGAARRLRLAPLLVGES